jgi:ribonuclease Z
MALMDRKKSVEIYAPSGIAHYLDCLQETLQYALTYPVEIHELQNPGVVCEEEEYTIFAALSNHVVQSFAFAIVEKARPGKFYPEKARILGVPEGSAWGKLQHGEVFKLPSGKIVQPGAVSGLLRNGRKIVYTGDTKPFVGFAMFALDADLVVHEATFDDSLVEKAELDGHSTPSQAAEGARAAGAKSLVLTHISARYSDTSVLLSQAKKVFANTAVAEDFLELELPLSE